MITFKEYIRDLRGHSDTLTNCLEQVHFMHTQGFDEKDERYAKAVERVNIAKAKLDAFQSKHPTPPRRD